jgi:hypothetical protein
MLRSLIATSSTQHVLKHSSAAAAAGLFPPGWKDGNAGTFRCGHHHLQAHAQAVHMYRTKYRDTQEGKLSIAVSTASGSPLLLQLLLHAAAAVWLGCLHDSHVA